MIAHENDGTCSVKTLNLMGVRHLISPWWLEEMESFSLLLTIKGKLQCPLMHMVCLDSCMG